MGNERDPGDSRPGTGDLSVEDETLAGFGHRIEELLVHLRNSPAAAGEVRDQTLTRDAYGGAAFGAADSLHATYRRAHGRMETFAQLFGEQIEALGIAVQVTRHGYDGVEADQLARLRAISANTQQHYAAPDAPSKSSDQQGTGTDRDVTY